MLSSSKVKRLGKEIKSNNGTVSTDQLALLQEYRISFIPALSKTFHSLRRISNKVNSEAIVAFRLKRIGTIVNKLIRQKNMQLNTMGDIAGLRCIFKNEAEVYRAFSLINEKFEVEGRCRDYIQSPKQIGYRGIHCYIRDEKYDKKVEIQLRTEDHHNWATLVEITDLLYDLRLKELGYESDGDFARFHSLISSDRELSLDEANFIYRILDDTDFISRLNDTFRTNFNEVKKSWWRQNRKHSFFLIEVEKGKIPLLKSFNSFNKAEEEYFNRYRNSENIEIVLASIKSPTFSQISIAYANYILAYHTFVKDIKPILKEMASEALEDKDFKKFKKIFKTYEELQANIIIDIISDDENLILVTKKEGNIKFQLKEGLSQAKRKEINRRINLRLKDSATEHNKYIRQLKLAYPSGYFNKFKYKQFLKRHNKRLRKHLSKKKIEFERFR